MNKRYGSILIVSVTILVLCFVEAASATNWTVNGSGGADFTGIQDAINNAKDGDSIMVHSGVYYENVVVDKSVTLKGIDQPVVDANCSGSAITLTEDRITLVGFTATGSSWFDAGIKVISNNNTITGNNASNNSWYGISLFDSSNNTITGNNVSNSDGGYGISLESSSNNNTITGNNICNNDEDGISISRSSNNTITGNNVSNNNDDGIFLYNSRNNNITGNNASNNYGGIGLFGSCNNTIYFNNFINNHNNNVHDYYESTINIWNSPFEITYTYDGTTYKSYLGNYWNDYKGTDAEGDGIGDTHYSIYSVSDDYPLMDPFENYNISTSAPA